MELQTISPAQEPKGSSCLQSTSRRELRRMDPSTSHTATRLTTLLESVPNMAIQLWDQVQFKVVQATSVHPTAPQLAVLCRARVTAMSTVQAVLIQAEKSQSSRLTRPPTHPLPSVLALFLMAPTVASTPQATRPSTAARSPSAVLSTSLQAWENPR